MSWFLGIDVSRNCVLYSLSQSVKEIIKNSDSVGGIAVIING